MKETKNGDQQYSRYWLDKYIFDDEDGYVLPPKKGKKQDDDDDDYEYESREYELVRISRLAAVRRAIANFVSIMSGKNVPVVYSSGKESSATKDMVIISADEDPSRFDVMVGLALHEGSHILKSDYAILHALVDVANKLQQKIVPCNWETPCGNHTSGNPVTNVIFRPELRAVLGPVPMPSSGVYSTGNFAATPLYLESAYWNKAIRMIQDLQFIMNILEDRRIDKYVYDNAQGYRPYYDSLYHKYLYLSDVGKNLKYNPEWRTPTVDNYIRRLLFSVHPDASPTAIVGLEQLIDMMDLSTIERVGPENDKTTMWFNPVTHEKIEIPVWYDQYPLYDDLPVLWREANNLYAYILQFATMAAAQMQQGQGQGQPQQGQGEGHPIASKEAGKPSSALDGLPNLDGAPRGPQEMKPTEPEKTDKGKEGKFNAKKGERGAADAKKMLEGETRKKKLNNNDAQAVKALEAADASMVDIKGDGVPFGKCMVTRKMSDELLRQDWFMFKRWGWEDERAPSQQCEKAVAAGKRMGAILVHRLQVRNDPIITKQTRLQSGGLDKRLLAQLGMDITSVFQKSRTDTHKPAMLHLTIDASGSMGGDKWERCRTVAVALAYVGSKLRNVDTVISIRGGNEIPIVSVIFDSRRDQFNRFLRYIKILEPTGATPEGLCFKATMDMILECAATHDVYFINFSDGEPAFGYSNQSGLAGKNNHLSREYFNYSGDVAYKHTRAMVQAMRDAGVKVLSYFISYKGMYSNGYENESLKAFKKMYGEDAVNVNVENTTEVLRTLNARLLVRGGQG